MIRTEHALLSPSLGHQKHLVSFTYGDPQARPKVYIQASLHAEELPGMLVSHHLRSALEAAELEGRLSGCVVLVPAANPIGLAQRLDHKAMGRFELDTGENFNRHYPDLAQAVFEQAREGLGQDPDDNVVRVRQWVGQWLLQWTPQTELQSQRRCLLQLSHDADVVIDLHCDWEAVMHLYSEEACWPRIQPLAAALACRAVLLAKNSGGGPFDERLSGLWWQLRERLLKVGVDRPLPQGCASTTVELRGEADVDHAHAQTDAQAIVRYLQYLGALQTQAPLPALPPMACEPTPLAGSQTLQTPVPGVLVYLVPTGAHLQVGDAVAHVIDPTAPETSRVRVVRAEVAGILYARVGNRYLVAGAEVGKIAGAYAFRTGDLLGA
jgi:predicted deacylase